MPRYGCYELRTSCDHCGNPVPINGPTREVRCSYCLDTISIRPESFESLLKDLLAEYAGLSDRQGRTGTLMSDRTYAYGYWRLAPQCPVDKHALPLDGAPADGEVACDCGRTYPIFPAPDWLRARLPARQIVCGEREQPEGSPAVAVSDAGMQPIAMACPSCGAGLQVAEDWARVHPCQFCSAQVFIPDTLWKHLHPVKKIAEWFILFDDGPAPAVEQAPPVRELPAEEVGGDVLDAAGFSDASSSAVEESPAQGNRGLVVFWVLVVAAGIVTALMLVG